MIQSIFIAVLIAINALSIASSFYQINLFTRRQQVRETYKGIENAALGSMVSTIRNAGGLTDFVRSKSEFEATGCTALLSTGNGGINPCIHTSFNSDQIKTLFGINDKGSSFSKLSEASFNTLKFKMEFHQVTAAGDAVITTPATLQELTYVWLEVQSNIHSEFEKTAGMSQGKTFGTVIAF